MKKISSFRGLTFNADKVSSFSDVMSPPYDVIDQKLQEQLYERSPYNFCRVDLTKETGEERYQKAKEVFGEWLASEVLIQDERPALYIHHHSFTLPNGQKITRKGFFAACRVEDFSQGGIKPHEKTLEGPKTDRLKMTRATQSNLSPVFSLYADPQKQIDALFDRLTQTTAFMDFMSHDGERHQLWKCTDADVATKVDELMKEKALFIADGHHRYETALNYRNEQQDLAEDDPAQYLLMYLSNMDDDGLVILPIHRAVHGVSLSTEEFLEKLSQFFDIEDVSSLSRDEQLKKLGDTPKDSHGFVFLTDQAKKAHLLSISHDKWLQTSVAQGLPQSLTALDVSVLHQLVFKEVLGLSEEDQANQKNIVYWKSTEKAISETESGQCQMTFLLNPTQIEGMKAVASEGHKMPQKSTYFYPKIISGLVVHELKKKA